MFSQLLALPGFPANLSTVKVRNWNSCQLSESVFSFQGIALDPPSSWFSSTVNFSFCRKPELWSTCVLLPVDGEHPVKYTIHTKIQRKWIKHMLPALRMVVTSITQQFCNITGDLGFGFFGGIIEIIWHKCKLLDLCIWSVHLLCHFTIYNLKVILWINT